MTVLEELRERRGVVWSEMTDILDESATEGMSHDQSEKHAGLEAEFLRLDRDVRARERAAKTAEDLDKPRDVPEGVGGPRSHELIADDKAYTRAYQRYLRAGMRNLSSADAALLEQRAQSVGIPTDGGYLVPTTFRDKLVERMKSFGGLATAVEEITTSDGRPMEWPTIDDTANEGEIVPENTQAAGGADLEFGTAALGAYKYMSTGANGEPFRVSVELLQDSAFDIESMITRLAGRRIMRKQARHWVNGTGVGEPKGLINGKTGIEIAADAAGVTYPDLVHFIHSVDPDYRMNAKWAFNDASLGYIRALVDDVGRPLWIPQSESGMGTLPGGSLLGYPVVIDQAFPDISAASNTVNWGAFGDLEEAYVIRRVKDITIVVDPYSRAKFGQVEYTVWARADGTVQNPNSYIALTGEA